jgi:hypothetical protein
VAHRHVKTIYDIKNPKIIKSSVFGIPILTVECGCESNDLEVAYMRITLMERMVPQCRRAHCAGRQFHRDTVYCNIKVS